MSDPASRDVLAAVESVARERFGWSGRLTRRTRLIEDLGLDSLKALEMLVEIENRFRIRIDEDAEGEIATVGDLVDVIRRALETDGERR